MIDMKSKYDNMHTNGIFNALNCINNHVNPCINCMLSRPNCVVGLVELANPNFFSIKIKSVLNIEKNSKKQKKK